VVSDGSFKSEGGPAAEPENRYKRRHEQDTHQLFSTALNSEASKIRPAARLPRLSCPSLRTSKRRHARGPTLAAPSKKACVKSYHPKWESTIEDDLRRRCRRAREAREGGRRELPF
jgi:hypothetical protein